MALNTAPRPFPRHFRPLSERERRDLLTRIDAAEREALQSEPAPLTADPYLLRTGQAQALAQAAPKPSPAPLRLIKPALHKRQTDLEQYQEAERITAHIGAMAQLTKPAPTACGLGTCALTPECTRSCRYREADTALRGHYSERQGQPQRAAMPAPKVDQRLRSIVWTGIALYMLGAVFAGIWAFTR